MAARSESDGADRSVVSDGSVPEDAADRMGSVDDGYCDPLKAAMLDNNGKQFVAVQFSARKLN